MEADRLVAREGDRAAATGRLVRNDLGDRFEPALPVAGPGGAERRVRPVWNGAVRVTGADFGAVAPPCPLPDGGWPATPRRGDVELSYDLGDLAGTGAAVAVTVFHPGPDQAVLVVAAADLAAVEARLRPLGRSLCVVPSRWTKNQLDGVRGHLH